MPNGQNAKHKKMPKGKNTKMPKKKAKRPKG